LNFTNIAEGGGCPIRTHSPTLQNSGISAT
jgi:hypothetical protein